MWNLIFIWSRRGWARGVQGYERNCVSCPWNEGQSKVPARNKYCTGPHSSSSAIATYASIGRMKNWVYFYGKKEKWECLARVQKFGITYRRTNDADDSGMKASHAPVVAVEWVTNNSEPGRSILLEANKSIHYFRKCNGIFNINVRMKTKQLPKPPSNPFGTPMRHNM